MRLARSPRSLLVCPHPSDLGAVLCAFQLLSYHVPAITAITSNSGCQVHPTNPLKLIECPRLQVWLLLALRIAMPPHPRFGCVVCVSSMCAAAESDAARAVLQPQGHCAGGRVGVLAAAAAGRPGARAALARVHGGTGGDHHRRRRAPHPAERCAASLRSCLRLPPARAHRLVWFVMVCRRFERGRRDDQLCAVQGRLLRGNRPALPALRPGHHHRRRLAPILLYACLVLSVAFALPLYSHLSADMLYTSNS